jgi:hypothetical protein
MLSKFLTGFIELKKTGLLVRFFLFQTILWIGCKSKTFPNFNFPAYQVRLDSENSINNCSPVPLPQNEPNSDWNEKPEVKIGTIKFFRSCEPILLFG